MLCLREPQRKVFLSTDEKKGLLILFKDLIVLMDSTEIKLKGIWRAGQPWYTMLELVYSQYKLINYHDDFMQEKTTGIYISKMSELCDYMVRPVTMFQQLHSKDLEYV